MSAVTCLASVAVPWLVGLALIRALGFPVRADRLAAAGYSYVLGAFATGLVLVGWLAAGLPLSPLLVNGALVSAAVVLELACRRRTRAAAAVPEPRPGEASSWRSTPAWQRAIFWLVVALAIAVVCDRALVASSRPVMDSDEAFIWAPRAKVLFHAGGLNERFRAEMLETSVAVADVVSHKDYPLLNSLLHLLAYVDAGRITNFENRVPIQAFGLALVCIAAAALRRLANPLVGAAMLLMIVSEVHVVNGFRLSMADGMAAVGLLCAADCFLREAATQDRCWARVGGLSLGFLAWSKHEGAMLAGLVAILVLALSRRRAAAWLVPPVAIVAITWTINHWFGFRNDLVQTGTDEGTIWPRLLAAFSERGRSLAFWFWRDYAGAPAVSRLLLFPLVLALFHPAVRARRALFATGLLLVAAVVADLWIFASTPRPFEWHWATAGARVLSQLNPAIAVVVGAMAGAVLARAPAPDGLRTASRPS
jgi:hypothetical protein